MTSAHSGFGVQRQINIHLLHPMMGAVGWIVNCA